MDFEVISKYTPSGDQPTAIDQLAKGLKQGYKYQTCWERLARGKLFRRRTSLKKCRSRRW